MCSANGFKLVDIKDSGNSNNSDGVDAGIWFDSNDKIIYWWSNADRAIMSSQSARVFGCHDDNAGHNDWDSLEMIDLTGLDFTEITNMSNMFRYCTGLKTIVFGDGFDTSNVTEMENMFQNCISFQSIDISCFNSSSLTNTRRMFGWCTELKTIIVDSNNSFDCSGVTNSSDMFKDSKKLVGGAGTVYNNSLIDAQVAVIDQGATKPGYFTANGN